MVRSRLALAGLLLLIVAVVAAKGRLSSRSAATTAPGSPAAPVVTAPAEAGAQLTGADLGRALRSGRPTVADFGEGWCEQCKKMVPVLAETTRRFRGKANVVFVDTKAHAEHARTYRIVRIPTQVFFDAKGREVSRHIGYYALADVSRALEELLPGDRSGSPHRAKQK